MCPRIGTKQMTTKPTWSPHTEHGRPKKQDNLPDSVYAFQRQRKEPLTDAAHVRNALARFDQVKGVADDDRDEAFANIKEAAAYYGVKVTATHWRELTIAQ